MKGWKTWTGAGLVFLSGGLSAFANVLPEFSWLGTLSQAVMAAGTALGLVGVGHKIEKSAE